MASSEQKHPHLPLLYTGGGGGGGGVRGVKGQSQQQGSRTCLGFSALLKDTLSSRVQGSDPELRLINHVRQDAAEKNDHRRLPALWKQTPGKKKKIIQQNDSLHPKSPPVLFRLNKPPTEEEEKTERSFLTGFPLCTDTIYTKGTHTAVAFHLETQWMYKWML